LAPEPPQPLAAPEPPPAESAAANLEPWQPAAPSSHGSRRLMVGLVVLVIAAAAVTGLAFALTNSPGQPVSGTGGAPHPAASPGAASSHAATAHSASQGPSPAATPPARTSQAQASASGSAPSVSTSASSAGGYGALPAGYYRFTNSTGFSIGVPDGWRISHQGHYVYVTDPSDANIYLLIDQSDHPKPNALADWEQQQASRESSYPGYHLISLRSVSYPQAEQAADWEFTYVKNGVLLHVLNRNILASASHAYALYWSTPDGDWSADYHYFQAFAATFRPAPSQENNSKKHAGPG